MANKAEKSGLGRKEKSKKGGWMGKTEKGRNPKWGKSPEVKEKELAPDFDFRVGKGVEARDNNMA